jgi:transcription termination/antitermination protein NusA
MRLKLNQETLGLSSLMERLARVRVKDCFIDNDTIYFIVASGEMGKALGKGGMNIKKIQNELGKKIKVIEYRDEVSAFIKNIIYPLKVEQIIQEEGVVLIKDSQKKVRSLLIGREGKNLEMINRAVQRFFNVVVKVSMI